MLDGIATCICTVSGVIRIITIIISNQYTVWSHS